MNVIQRKRTIGSIILMRFRKLIRWTALAGFAGAVVLVLGVLFTGLIGLGCFILGLLLIGIAAWSFLRRQASLGRMLSSVTLVGGLLCLAPALWFFALLSGRGGDPLTLLVWLVAAGIAIIVGILARRREHDPIARRMAATGLGLSIALTAGWPLGFFAYGLVANGGSANSALASNDTWTWDGTTWTKQQPAVTPPPRANARMAYDAVRGVVVLFGGNNADGDPLGDTWTWDGHNWTKHATVPAPPARDEASLAFDPAVGKVVMFGGEVQAGINSRYYGDTWLWDGHSWEQATNEASPPARHDAAMVFDQARGVLLLYGGTAEPNERAAAAGAGADLNDTWTWDGKTWTQVASGPSVGNPVVAYDPGTKTPILVGALSKPTLSWDGKAWHEVAGSNGLPVLAGAALARDRLGRVIAVGGNTFTALVDGSWTWNGRAWIELKAAELPQPRSGAAIAYDEGNMVTVLFGGWLAVHFELDLP